MNAACAWSPIVKTLHWTLLLALLVEVPVGFLMSFTYGPSFHDRHILALQTLASQVHHTTGFLILASALVWVGLRLLRPRPSWPTGMPGWQCVLARLVHGSLLALLVLIPWSGWTALSALADSPSFGATHLWLFGADGLVPRIWRPLPATDPAGYARFAGWHVWLLRVGMYLLAVHVASALWHQFIHRDGLLGRMWPRVDA